MQGEVTKRRAIGLLRVYGPASIATLANAGKVDRQDLYNAVAALARDGLAFKEPRLYGLTEAGRLEFDRLYVKPLLEA